MMWVGLTGGIASGKSTVTKMLREKKISVICADEVAKSVVQHGTVGFEKVVDLFGDQVIGQDGELNRKKIGELVFNRPDLLVKLERIVHPLVKKEVGRQKKDLESQGCQLCFYDVPLLFEKKMEDDFDQIVLVYCDEATQKKRLMARNNMSESDAEVRLKAQIPIDEKLHRSDYILKNSGTLENLAANLDVYLNGLST